jgi:hypothetical protein
MAIQHLSIANWPLAGAGERVTNAIILALDLLIINVKKLFSSKSGVLDYHHYVQCRMESRKPHFIATYFFHMQVT